jgi:hypothetical protein
VDALHQAGLLHHDMQHANILLRVIEEGSVTLPPTMEVVLAGLGGAGMCSDMNELINARAW